VSPILAIWGCARAWCNVPPAPEVSDGAREWILVIATVGAAIGTLGATALALWASVLKEWRRRPVLSLHFAPRSQDAQVVMAVKPGGSATRAAFARLRVGNAAGKVPAQNVEYPSAPAQMQSAAELLPCPTVPKSPFRGGQTAPAQSPGDAWRSATRDFAARNALGCTAFARPFPSSALAGREGVGFARRQAVSLGPDGPGLRQP
jgi:hypothetical protein